MANNAILMATAGRKSVTAVALYAVSALRNLEDVTVCIRDADPETLWGDEACASALNVIAARTRLEYRRGAMNGIGADRWELMEEAMEKHPHILLMDADAVLPEEFLILSRRNLRAAGEDYGFVGHFGMDTLNPSHECFREAISGGYDTDKTHYNWQKTGPLKDGLYPANSVSGFCVWYRSEALRAVRDPARRVMRYLACGEDSGLCVILSSRLPCFVADQPWVRHYRSIERRTSKELLVAATQRTSYSELRRLGVMDEERSAWFQGLMKNFHDD